jgi:hypothetical protein
MRFLLTTGLTAAAVLAGAAAAATAGGIGLGVLLATCACGGRRVVGKGKVQAAGGSAGNG